MIDDAEQEEYWESPEPEEIRAVLEQLVGTDRGAWQVADLERLVTELRWRPRMPVELYWPAPPLADGRSPHHFFSEGGPKGTALTRPGTPDEIDRIEFPIAQGDAEVDVRTVAVSFRETWQAVETVLGPPAWWGGASGAQWLQWPMGEDRLVVTLDWFFPDIEMHLCRGTGVAPTESDVWRAAALDLLPDTPPRNTGPAGWERLEERLGQVLGRLAHDAPVLPAMAIGHLTARHHPKRFVSFWTEGLGLCIEAMGLWHEPELADERQLAALGWEGVAGGVRQRRYPEAMEHREDGRNAAHLLVQALRMLDIDLADLTCEGTLATQGHLLHLDFPRLGVPRMVTGE